MNNSKLDSGRYRGLIALFLSMSLSEGLKMELLKKFLETEEFRSLQQDFPELDKEAFTKSQDNWLLSAITQSSIEVESNSIDLFREDFEDDVMKKVLGEILVKAQELFKS